jgi:hypothetical protein
MIFQNVKRLKALKKILETAYRKTPLKLPWATKTLKPIISKTKKGILIR